MVIIVYQQSLCFCFAVCSNTPGVGSGEWGVGVELTSGDYVCGKQNPVLGPAWTLTGSGSH